MKATHNKASEPNMVEWKFPCIGIRQDQGLIILFTERNCGTVLSVGDSPYFLGAYGKGWAMDMFQPLPSTESVTLQND
jgi:hypothetical protein